MHTTATPTAAPGQPRVVIVGAGFAGLWAARELARSLAEVVLLDRNNYHTFLPLLYQVAAAELEPEHIIHPVRSIFHGQPRVHFRLETVTGLDLESRRVHTAGHTYSYDYLLLATGSAAHFFGVAGAAEFAFQLKTLPQAITLRNHILCRFERAVCEPEAARRRQTLTFAIIGGGPTGVEFAGALAELIRGPLAKDYPSLNLREARLVLLEAAEALLPGFPERLRVYAAERLRRMGVEVRPQTAVRQVTPQAIHLSDGTEIATETVVWTAGVRSDPPDSLGALPLARNGQVKVLNTLQAPGHSEVYLAGDLAASEAAGRPLPMTAPVALQAGQAAARNILRQMAGEAPLPFHYRHLGTMAVIGRNAAVAQVGGYAFTGFPAWVLWLSVHLVKLIGFRNRLLVLINWAWDYLRKERAVRVIVPGPDPR